MIRTKRYMNLLLMEEKQNLRKRDLCAEDFRKLNSDVQLYEENEYNMNFTNQGENYSE